MDLSRIVEGLKAWQASETAKRTTLQQRLVHIQPLREKMLRRILAVSLILLPVHAVLVVRAGMPVTLKNLVGALLWPGLSMLAVALCLRYGKEPWRMGLAVGMLFQGITFAAAVPQAILSGRGGYSQYGGMIILTILLSGLLIGEFYVAAWTFICCVSFQYAINDMRGWAVNLGWSAVYVAAGWLVIQFSRHLERFHEAGRLAEEQQRSAIVAERARFARDVHDNLGQGLTAIVMQLNAAGQQLQENSAQAGVHIEKARQLARESLEEARRSVSALRSPVRE